MRKLKLRIKLIITTIRLYKVRWEVNNMIRKMEREENSKIRISSLSIIKFK